MKYTLPSILLMSLVLLSGCVSSSQNEDRPQWIDQANIEYPSDQYLSAVGQASNLTRARQNALANLSDIFSVKVHAQSNMLTQANKQETPLGVSMQSESALQRQINTESEHTLKGVKIEKSWQSPTAEYYVLAVLEKYKAAQSLTASMSELDEKTADLLAFSTHDAPNVIASLHALTQARDLQIARNAANTQLQQVRLMGEPAPISTAKIEKIIAKKLASLEVSVQQDSASQQKLIASALAQLGLRVVAQSDLNVSAELSLSEPVFASGWYWLRGSYQMSFIEKGQSISRKSWPLKVSAKQQSQLEPRLDDYLNQHIQGYVNELMSSLPAL